MLANLFAKTSQGISYPYLYLNSAASPWARCANARASAIEPVITLPTDGEIWKRCDTEEGSISLSWHPELVSAFHYRAAKLGNN